MDKYRVIVLREGAEADETLFEIAGSAARVARIAPGALIDVLAEDSESWADGQRAAQAASVADRVFDAAVAAGADAEAEQDAADEAAGKPKRTRRTKAQIAADKEAQGLGYRDAAHRAEVEAQQQNGVTVTTTFAGATPVPPPGEVVVGSVPGAIVTGPQAAPAAPPYNPFAQ